MFSSQKVITKRRVRIELETQLAFAESTLLGLVVVAALVISGLAFVFSLAPGIAAGPFRFRHRLVSSVVVGLSVAQDPEEPRGLEDLEPAGLVGKDVFQEVVDVADGHSELEETQK